MISLNCNPFSFTFNNGFVLHLVAAGKTSGLNAATAVFRILCTATTSESQTTLALFRERFGIDMNQDRHGQDCSKYEESLHFFVT